LFLTSESPEGDVIMACSCKNPTTALPKPYQRAVGVRRRVVAMFAVDRLVTSGTTTLVLAPDERMAGTVQLSELTKRGSGCMAGTLPKQTGDGFAGHFFHLVFMVSCEPGKETPLVFDTYWLVLCSS